MLNYAYTNFGGYFWVIATAAVAFLAMKLISKSFTPLTANITDEKTRRGINMGIGIALSITAAIIAGQAGNLLFGSDVPVKWFVFGGLLANFVYLIREKYVESELAAFGKAFKDAVKESNLDIDESDIPQMTVKIKDIVKAFATSSKNKHAVAVNNVAKDIAGAVEISEEDREKLVREIEALKSRGADVGRVEKAFRDADEDGKITVAEKEAIEGYLDRIRETLNR